MTDDLDHDAYSAHRDVSVENRLSLGKGHVQTVYRLHRDGSPRMIGLTISEAAMETLPTYPVHDGNTQFDIDGDGMIDPMKECAGGHERVLFFPEIEGLPFKWMMFNWQPMGHGPPHVFNKPHFDLHFFIQDYIARNFIRTGPCGLILNCDDEVRAKQVVPDPFNPVGFGLPGAAGRMGNHLIDPNVPPANGGPFTQAFAYGTYDGHISFWEPVYAVDWLQTKPDDAIQTIPWTPEVELSGYYPHTAHARYRKHEADFLFTLEDFEYRTAPPGTLPPDWGDWGGGDGGHPHG